MSYIGNPISIGNLTKETFNGGTTGYTLSYSVGSDASLAVYISGVHQVPTTDYTTSGTGLTFTSSTPSGTNNICVVYLSLPISLPVPGDGTVTDAKLASDAVTTAKILNNAVDETKLKDALIGDFTEVVVSASDSLLIGDATDGNTKRDTVQGILDLASHTGNVAFPASQVASADVNTLDDYQEGTWTPVVTATTNDHTYNFQYGNYVKIGKYVHCHALVSINAVNSTSGNSRFGGLPFTASATTGNYGLMFVAGYSSLNITAGYDMYGRVDLNETSGSFEIRDSGTSSTSIQFSEISAGATIYFSVQYYV